MTNSGEIEQTMLSIFEKRVRRTIAKHRMLKRGDHVLVAVSGGADSMALLFCLQRIAPGLQLVLAAAHLNHGIRGAEGDADETFVRDYCQRFKISFISEAADIKSQAAATKQNLEDVARRMRYDFLRRAAAKVGAGKIAVGHNLNDQAETVLLRLMRGSGIEGLAAIHPIVDKTIIRPLLECSRPVILKYLTDAKIPFREDSSNLDLGFSRNRVRAELIPYLEKSFNPHLLQVLAREAELSRELLQYLDAQSRHTFEAIRAPTVNGVSLYAKGLSELHPALQKLALRQALKECRGSLRGIALSHILGILGLCRSGKSGRRVELPDGFVALRQFDRLLLLENDLPEAPQFRYVLSVPGRCIVPQSRLEIAAELGQIPKTDDMPVPSIAMAYLDASQIPNKLVVRSRVPGDRYGGATRKKVKKLLIDSRISILERSVLPMIATPECVLWIPGFKPAKPFRVEAGDFQGCVVILTARPF
jgi:tRNA(Ile)-lysidine synthase